MLVRVSVCTFKTSPCVPSKTPTCSNKHADVLKAHTSQQHAQHTAHTDDPEHTYTSPSPRGRNGPSTRVPRVVLITSFGSHVSSRMCLLFKGLWDSLSSHASKLDVRIQGLLLGCAVISLLWCKSQFPPHSRWIARLSTILSSWCVVSSRQIPGARSTADRQATCQVVSTQASTSKNESKKVCLPLAHDSELVDLLACKVVLWITPSGGKDAQTAVRRPPPGPVGRGSI